MTQRRNLRKRRGVQNGRCIVMLVLLLMLNCQRITYASVDAEISFAGHGSKSSPYLIEDYEDLCLLRELVNSGNGFENTWFRQTADIVMETEDWRPIGIYGSGNYFWGIYDGFGHVIDGLSCKYHQAGEQDNNGLFGQLGGVVVNLGLENVSVEGECCGAIASHAVGTDRTAAIINCYVRGQIRANRSGGIADNFNYGTIANCISDVTLSFVNEENLSEDVLQQYRLNYAGGTASMASDVKIYGCQTTAHQVLPESFRTRTSAIITKDELRTEQFVTELNVRTALAQELFGDQFGVELMQWELSDDRMLAYSEDTSILELADFLNEFLLAAVLGIVGCVILWRIAVGVSMEDYWHRNKSIIAAVCIVSGIIALFVDCAALGTARKFLGLGSGLFIGFINLYFIVSAGIMVRYGLRNVRKLRVNRVLTALMAGLLVLEIMQFDTVPRYDAGLYYGSLVRGIKLFRLDFLSYIGAFVSWKWIHGIALLITPFEFLFPGEMVGAYISYALITQVTVVILYKLIRECVHGISPVVAAVSSICLMLCPYQLGMFTYLCLDTHCVYFAVWLLYSYKHKKHVLTAFCGYLLCFTKTNWAVFYIVFLVTATGIEVLREYNGPIVKRIFRWWKWSTCLLWMLPVGLYCVAHLIGHHFMIQHLDGAYIAPFFGDKSLVAFGNTLAQTFVFGFRWLMLLLIGAATIKFAMNSKAEQRLFKENGIRIIASAVAAGAAVIMVLLLYDSDAECPRYTAVVNVVYTILIPIAICVLIQKEWLRRTVSSALAALLLVQTYWTIDPSIVLHETHIDTGTNELYRLALDDDDRPGMNLGADYSVGYRSVGDIYAYNIEYNYYDDLIRQTLEKIDPDADDLFYVLDVIDYELHLKGQQYIIYWNTRTKRSTYNGDDPDSIILRQGSVTTDLIVSGPEIGLNMGDDFYLVVPARVDTEAAMQGLTVMGYELSEELYFENVYGSMYVYHMQR